MSIPMYQYLHNTPRASWCTRLHLHFQIWAWGHRRRKKKGTFLGCPGYSYFCLQTSQHSTVPAIFEDHTSVGDTFQPLTCVWSFWKDCHTHDAGRGRCGLHLRWTSLIGSGLSPGPEIGGPRCWLESYHTFVPTNTDLGAPTS